MKKGGRAGQSFLQVSPTVRSLGELMLLRASLVSGAVCLLLAVPPAAASSGDHDPDQDATAAAGPTRAVTGKPVAFDRGWLTPFFEHGPARQAVEQFRAEDWEAAETGFAKAVKSLPRDGRRAAGGAVHARARARQPVEVGGGGPAVRGSLRQLPEARAVSRLQRRPLSAAARRRGGRAGVGRRASPTAASRRRRRSWCAWMRCARSGAGATCSRPSRASCSSGRTARATPNRCSARRRRWRRSRPAAATRARPRPTSPRSTAASGRRRRYRRGATAPPSGSIRSRRRCPTAEAAIVRAHTAGEWVSRGMVLFDQNRNVESEAAFNSALTAPAWTPISSAAPASTARNRPGSNASARARRRCSTRPRPPARARRTATSMQRRCTRGRAATRARGTATSRWRTTRASKRSTPTTATRTTRGCDRRSWRPTRATSPPPPSCCRKSRPATRRATC